MIDGDEINEETKDGEETGEVSTQTLEDTAEPDVTQDLEDEDLGEEIEIIAGDESVDETDSEDSEVEDLEAEEVISNKKETTDTQGDFYGDEDLSTAYNLEDGELIDEVEGDGLPSQTNVKSAKDFFSTEILYRFDILEDNTRNKLKGSYLLELSGKDGGSWTITIDNDMDIKNEKSEAEVTLNMRQKDFVMMVNGELNPQLSLLSEKYSAKGDIDKIFAIQELLVPNLD